MVFHQIPSLGVSLPDIVWLIMNQSRAIKKNWVELLGWFEVHLEKTNSIVAVYCSSRRKPALHPLLQQDRVMDLCNHFHAEAAFGLLSGELQGKFETAGRARINT